MKEMMAKINYTLGLQIDIKRFSTVKEELT